MTAPGVGRIAITLGLIVLAPSCGRGPAGGGVMPTETPWLDRSIPPRDAIVGRVVTNRIVSLLMTSHRIVQLDLARRQVTSVPIRDVNDDEQLAGFAGLPDGSLWTLSGWSTLLKVTARGEIVERRPLREPQAGLHSGFGELVFQPVGFAGGSPALITLPAGDGGGAPTPWGALTVHNGPEPAAIRAAQSLAACGPQVQERIPCWLANAAAIELSTATGGVIRVEIPALAERVSTDAAAFAKKPHRVIRDAWLKSSSEIWLLVRAEASDAPDRRGERGLWLVGSDGGVRVRRVLRTRARMIVGVEDKRVFVVTEQGSVVLVEA